MPEKHFKILDESINISEILLMIIGTTLEV